MAKMQKIKISGFAGTISIEVINNGYENLQPYEFLKLAYKRAEKLRSMVN
ncbi:MAG: hypothetical protein PHI32_11080 [Dysgonamonadaceae bacterium]|nr:hypothetical protein [Dysgonamonadaceae bacterium]